MKIISIIPARYNSTRFPGKVLIEVNGKPLIVHVYEKVKKSNIIEDVIVATDDKRIFDTIKKINGNVVMTKKHLTGTDRITEVARKINADIIVNVQADQVLFNPKMIEELVLPFFHDSTVYMTTLIRKIDRNDLQNPNIVKVVIDKNKDAIYFSRSSIPYLWNDIPGFTFYSHIGMYAYKKKFLLTFAKLHQSNLEKVENLEQLRVIEYGYKIRTVITKYNSFSIETKEDLEKLKNL